MFRSRSRTYRRSVSAVWIGIVCAVAIAAGVFIYMNMDGNNQAGGAGKANATGAAGAGADALSGFPKDEVPLVAGAVAESSHAGITWNVSVKVSDESAQQRALDALTGKGFQIIGQSKTSAGTVYALASNNYSVRLGLTKTTDGFTIDYGVAKRAVPAQTEAPASAAAGTTTPTSTTTQANAQPHQSVTK